MLEHLYKVRFSPPTKDGHPVGGVTYARQEACAIPEGSKYRLAVRYLGNGPSFLRPKGERAVLRVPLDSKPGAQPVVLNIVYKVLPDGALSVDAVDVVSGQRRNSRDYVSATRAWLEAQRAEPEQVDGVPVPTQVNFKFAFGPGQTFYGSTARAQAEKHSQVENEKARLAQIAASRACATAARGSDAQSQHVAINSPFHALSEEEAVQ
jgi:hypothetical protein